MTGPALVLVAHGTRNPRGVEVVAALAEAVRPQIGTVRVAFVDVLGPSPAEVLRDPALTGPVVLVPAFLASGYHVHADLPREIDAGERDGVHVTRALGPDPALAAVMAEDLTRLGWKQGDPVVIAAAGSSDPRAVADVDRAREQLADALSTTVVTGYIATGRPRVPCVVANLRANGADRVFVASYLLAPGLFHTRVRDCGATGVTEPLGRHESVVDLLLSRYRAGTQLIESVSAESRPGRR
ncbi:sirohydrochlorin chelatase [Actinomycetes bacterium M1A6_2h]